MAADAKTIEIELDRIERAITILKRDYEIFFAGGTRQPPNDQRDKLDKAIKKLGTDPTMNYALRFRYTSLVSRFNTYMDLWNKQLRAKEEGRAVLHTLSGKHRTLDMTGPVHKPPEPARPPEPPKPKDSVQQIYQEYVQRRKDLGEGAPNMTAEGFAQVIAKQKQAIIQKMQCKDVEFYVAVEEGHTKLKARPLK